MNNHYQKEYSVTFKKAYKTVKRKAEDKKRNSIAQEIKENTENQWEETAFSRLIYQFDLYNHKHYFLSSLLLSFYRTNY